MTDKNWGLILGMIMGLVTFGVALLSGVSDETAMLRGVIGAVVGGFVGFGFNFLASSMESPPVKGRRLDVTLPQEATEDDAHGGPEDFHPLDFTQMARVVKSQVESEGGGGG